MGGYDSIMELMTELFLGLGLMLLKCCHMGMRILGQQIP